MKSEMDSNDESNSLRTCLSLGNSNSQTRSISLKGEATRKATYWWEHQHLKSGARWWLKTEKRLAGMEFTNGILTSIDFIVWLTQWRVIPWLRVKASGYQNLFHVSMDHTSTSCDRYRDDVALFRHWPTGQLKAPWLPNGLLHELVTCLILLKFVESRLCSNYIFEKTSVPTGNLWQFSILTWGLWLALRIWSRWFEGPYLFKYNLHPCSMNINLYELRTDVLGLSDTGG